MWQECSFYTAACIVCSTSCFRALPCANSSFNLIIKTGFVTLDWLTKLLKICSRILPPNTNYFLVKQPTLRHLAVSTLRHLIEKDPVSRLNLCLLFYFFFLSLDIFLKSPLSLLGSCSDSNPYRMLLLKSE